MPNTIHEQYHGKNVLITGGLGFIGSSLAVALVRAAAKVTIADCHLEGSGANFFNVEEVQDDIKLAKTDIGDPQRVRPLVEKAEYIFNCSGYNNHRDGMMHPEKDLYANSTSQLTFLSVVAEANSQAPIVFVGTRTQYGRATGDPIAEDSPMRPLDVHGAHKVLTEYYHKIFHRDRGLKTIILRAVNTYGPRQALRPRNIGLLAGFIAAALEDKEIEIYGDGQRSREIVFVDDVVDGLLRIALCTDAEGESFNLGGFVVSLREIAETCVSALGSGRIVVKPFPSDVKRIEAGDVRLDCSKIEKACGWKARTAPNDGLRRTASFLLQHQKEYL